jgi:hypothetical protein
VKVQYVLSNDEVGRALAVAAAEKAGICSPYSYRVELSTVRGESEARVELTPKEPGPGLDKP